MPICVQNVPWRSAICNFLLYSACFEAIGKRGTPEAISHKPELAIAIATFPKTLKVHISEISMMAITSPPLGDGLTALFKWQRHPIDLHPVSWFEMIFIRCGLARLLHVEISLFSVNFSLVERENMSVDRMRTITRR